MNALSSSSPEPKMGRIGRKRDANGKIIYSSCDLKKRVRPNRIRHARLDGSEQKKTKQKNADNALFVEAHPELGLRRCPDCRVTKSLGAFDVPVATSKKTTFKCCRQCCDSLKASRHASGETKYTMERARIRSLKHQNDIKATLLGTEGYEAYSAACDAANPAKTPGVPKPRLPLEQMEEKPLNHGMFDTILSCLFSNIFLEVCRSTN